MHVSQGHAHEARRYPGAGKLHGIRVRSRATGLSTDLVRNILACSSLNQLIENHRVNVSPATDDRSSPDLLVSDAALVHAG